jgi:LmbE family N-acetylglucosaminyl deacetylase
MKAIGIGCHPDDVEFVCSGTLALLKDKGWEVAIGIVAKGDCGTNEMSRTKISQVRRKEAEAAARILGCEIYFMGQDDLNVEVDPVNRRIATEVVRKARPDVVITHSPSDYMTDHEFASRLARDACFCASCPNYETNDPDPADPTDAIPTLYYGMAAEGIDMYGRPTPVQFFVDIGSKLALKKEMLACHASQRNWLRAQHGVDQYLIELENWDKKCGARAGFAFAEGFHQHLGHAFPKKNLVAEALGDLVKFA